MERRYYGVQAALKEEGWFIRWLYNLKQRLPRVGLEHEVWVMRRREGILNCSVKYNYIGG